MLYRPPYLPANADSIEYTSLADLARFSRLPENRCKIKSVLFTAYLSHVRNGMTGGVISLCLIDPETSQAIPAEVAWQVAYPAPLPIAA